MKRFALIAALFVAAWFVVRSPALAQVPGGPGCCQRIGSCVVGSCYTSPTQSSGQFWKGLTCTNGKDCVAAGTFSSADPQSTAVTVPDVKTPEGTTIHFVPNISIPGSDFTAGGTGVEVTDRTIGDYITAVYVWFAGAAGVLAVFMVMFGGFQWVTAAGNAGRIGQAKETITGAVVGLVLLLGSYVLLNTISPSFVEFKSLTDIFNVETISLGLAPHGSIALEAARSGQILVKDRYNQAACPSIYTMTKGFSGFVTGYYRPDITMSGGYQDLTGKPDPYCNIAMQCSCVTTGQKTCAATSAYRKNWSPCDPAKLGNNYCNATASGVPPVAFSTAAGDPSCFGFGTQFQIVGVVGSGYVDPAILGPTWTVQDSGDDIRRRHFDLFTGQGTSGGAIAFTLADEVTIKVIKYCDPGTKKQPGTCHTLAPIP